MSIGLDGTQILSGYNAHIIVSNHYDIITCHVEGK